jgi:hypothetical protein
MRAYGRGTRRCAGKLRTNGNGFAAPRALSLPFLHSQMASTEIGDRAADPAPENAAPGSDLAHRLSGLLL